MTELYVAIQRWVMDIQYQFLWAHDAFLEVISLSSCGSEVKVVVETTPIIIAILSLEPLKSTANPSNFGEVFKNMIFIIEKCTHNYLHIFRPYWPIYSSFWDVLRITWLKALTFLTQASRGTNMVQTVLEVL